MRLSNPRSIVALFLIVLIGAFWFLVLSPKRAEEARLAEDVAELQSAVAEQEQLASAAEDAQDRFPTNYRRLVVLGKAVPQDSDTSSLLVQLSHLASKSDVDFRAITLSADETAAPAPPPTAEPQTPAASAEQSEQEVAAAEAGSAPATVSPTESVAATLPLGASVGDAGLATMPYELNFRGDFFQIADFVSQLNKMVGLHRDGTPTVSGRLVTIDGFSLSVPDETDPAAGAAAGALEANFAVTTYVTPPQEGVTAGATPAGPAPPDSEPVPAASDAPSGVAATASAGTAAASATGGETP